MIENRPFPLRGVSRTRRDLEKEDHHVAGKRECFREIHPSGRPGSRIDQSESVCRHGGGGGRRGAGRQRGCWPQEGRRKSARVVGNSWTGGRCAQAQRPQHHCHRCGHLPGRPRGLLRQPAGQDAASGQARPAKRCLHERHDGRTADHPLPARVPHRQKRLARVQVAASSARRHHAGGDRRPARNHQRIYC